MKAEILKIAGVKSEKEFYKKYPSEEAFIKAHGKEFKKAKLKTAMIRKAETGLGIGSYTGGERAYNPTPISYNELYNEQDYMHTGSTQQMRDAKAYQQQMLNSANKETSGGGGGFDMKQLQQFLGGNKGGGGGSTTKIAEDAFSGGGANEAGALTDLASSFAKNGRKIKKAQGGESVSGYPVMVGPPTPEQYWNSQYGSPNSNMVGPINPNYSEKQYGAPGTQMVGPPTQNQYNMLNSPDDTYTAGQKQKQDRNKKIEKVSKFFGIAGPIVKGINMLSAEKQKRREAEQQAVVSDATLQASLSTPEVNKRKYVRPEDALIQPNQLFPTYGVGTNVLAKDGARIGGNMTEIQNMYNPGNLYSDLGYEPLNDSTTIKKFGGGGFMSQFAGAGGGDLISSGMEAGYGENAGGNIGNTVGKTAGKAIGNAILPGVGGVVGGMLGGVVGDIGGRLLDRNPGRIKAAQNRTRQNIQTAALNSGAKEIHANYSQYVKDGGLIPYAEDGGWVSNDWMPQVITQFDGHPIKSLLTKDPMMDTLRTGGHITQNNMYPQDQYALGGSLKTTWGGYAETISRNPYMPGTGETVMFRGKSHEQSDGNGHTGIGVDYGDDIHDSYTDYAEFGSKNAPAKVEVEKGEPASEMIDPQTGEKNMVVFGNLKVPKQLIPEANGKKFKNYIKDISKKEDRQNKIKEKAITNLDSLDDYSPIGLLKQNSYKANFIGSDMNQQKFAEIKKNASVVQNALHDTANEHGVDVVALAKGKIKIDKEAMKEQAKYGKEIFKAQTGTTEPANFVGPTPDDYLENLYEQAKKEKKGPTVELFQKEFHRFYPNEAKDIILEDPRVTSRGKKLGIKTHKDLEKADVNTILKTNVDNIFGDRTEQYHTKLQELRKPYTPIASFSIPTIGTSTTTPSTTKVPVDAVKAAEAPWWINPANQLIDYLRPSDQEEFDYSQLYPEMMAASMNQLEGVPMQKYNPQLLTPYDISYQDQLNEVTAQTRAAERMARNNPAAAAAILSTASTEKNKILAEQFRQNQAQKMGVYNQNIATLNDAQLKNLALFDNQYERQAKAKSNTKAQALEIAKSMSDKIAKQKLENKTLGVYENLYNYRFDKNGKAYNMNPLTQFSVAAGANSSSQAAPEGYEYETILKKKKKDEDKSRNGSIVKAIKNL